MTNSFDTFTMAMHKCRCKEKMQQRRLPRVCGRALLVLFLCVAMLSASLSAQITGRGTIAGVVSDASGAVIPEAKIAVIDVATNAKTHATSNSTGYFEANNLNPSTYTVEVTADGFTTLVRQGITLPASATVNVPLILKVSSQGETVTVTGDADLLNTETGSTGMVLTTRQIEGLPASGANPMQAVAMAIGIQAPNSQVFSASDTLSWNGVSKFGTTGYLNANEFIIDGAPNMGNPRGNAIQLSQEEVDQMKVDGISFEPEMGHTMGAMVVQTTKSGTNQYHGSVHWFYQDAAWAAMEHFQGLNYRHQQVLSGCTDGSSDSKCLLLKYQYGNPGTHVNIGSYSLGGPVWLPKIYNGHNKLFFFVNVNNNIWKDASVSTISIPTIQERSGNFSDLPTTTTGIPSTYIGACGAGTPYYGQYQIYNPFSVTLDAKSVPRRTPFCGNVVTSSLMNTTKALTSFYNNLLPTPTQTSPTGSNYTYTSVGSYSFRQFTQRMDYAPSDSDRIFFRWSRAHYHKEASGFTVGNVDAQISPKWIELGSLGYNRVINATTNLAITVGASSWKTGCCYYPGYMKYSSSSVGLPSYIDDYAGKNATLPIFSVGNVAQIGQTNSSRASYRNLSFSSVLNHMYKNHSFRVGGEWRQQSYSQAAAGNSEGTYTFDSSYTQQNNGSDSAYPSSNVGLSYASFLMGISTSASIGKGSPVSIRTPYYALYIGDTWRLTRKLTLLPGLRFEYEYGPAEKRNAQIVGWDANASLPIATLANTGYAASLASATATQLAVMPTSLTIQGGPMYAGMNGAPTRQFVNDYRVLPRIAVAYQIKPNTVIRAGYGLYTDTINAHDAGGSPHSSISGATGTWGGVQFGVDQDGYSTSTGSSSSTTYGQNFTVGSTPLSDPFPTSNGSRFNSAVGNTVGSMYYVGSNPTIYDHNMKPTRAQRWYVGAQRQLNSSLMVEVAYIGSYASQIAIGQTISTLPSSFYSSSQQPNTAVSSLMSSQIINPFAIGNFSSLSSSNPAAYARMALNSYFTASKVNVSNVLRNYPQMSGFGMYRSVGESHFHEAQVNVTKRYGGGLVMNGSLQMNWQNDRDYYANAYDANPSWEPSNNSMPYRITGSVLYELPIGRGKRWVSSGMLGKVVGGLQLAGSYERQPGPLVAFGNLYYIGTPSKDIKLKHPVYVNTLDTGGSAYVKWLNPGNVTTTYSGGSCTYSGTGFVTNSSCQPMYNSRLFPTRVKGVRQQATDTVQASIQKKFSITDRVQLETRCDAYNLLNRQVLGAPNVTPTSANFGRITGDGTSNGAGNARWLSIQGRLRF